MISICLLYTPYYAILYLLENKCIIINQLHYFSPFSKSTLFALFHKLQFLTLFISFAKYFTLFSFAKYPFKKKQYLYKY